MTEEEKVSIEISKKIADLIEANKEKDEPTEAFLMRMLGIANEDESIRRILFIGPPAAGKSTIRSVFFEDSSPQVLIDDPLEPTRGIENYTYNWLDVSAGVADSAGQEIERWLGLDQEQAFGESDSIIFVMDVSQFDKFKDQVMEDLVEALNSKALVAPKAQFNLFLHKIDLIDEKIREERLAEVKTIINNHLKEHDHKADMILLKYYYTSIRGDLILSLVKAMRSVLYSYSKIMRRALIPYSMRL